MVEERDSTIQGTSPAPARGHPPTQVAADSLRRSTDRQERAVSDQMKAIASYADEDGFDPHHFFVDGAIGGTSADGASRNGSSP